VRCASISHCLLTAAETSSGRSRIFQWGTNRLPKIRGSRYRRQRGASPFPFHIREGVWLGGCCVPAPENFFLNLMPWHIVARNYYNVKRRAVARYKTRFAGVYITFTRNRPYTSSKTSITGESVHV